MELVEDAVSILIVIGGVITAVLADHSIELLIEVIMDFKAIVILLRVRHYYCWIKKKCHY